MEHRSACPAYTMQTTEQANNMVVLTPQYVELPLYTKYRGEGELLPHRDPPIHMMVHLPHPLGRSVPRNAEWYDMFPLEYIQFKELYELTKMMSPAARMRQMNVAFQCAQAQQCVDNPKPDWFGVGPGTSQDIIEVLQGWKHNPEGIPLLIHREFDGTLNISDIDLWMWLKKLSPKSQPLSTLLRPPLISLFSELGQWSDLINP
jgi:hypothetical protein